ncbi:unnamed protein product [Alopecurus aequalis]
MDSSSLSATSQPPTATQADDREGDPDEFKQFTDKELQSKIKRSGVLHVYAPDGGEKLRNYICRVEKELDTRRAARPRARKGEEDDAKEFKNFTDQDLQLKIQRLHTLSSSTPNGGKKLVKYICQVEKELDRHRAAGQRKVEAGWRQEVQAPSVDDPYAFMPQLENTSNHAPLIDTEATDGGLNPFASTNLEGQVATSNNLEPAEVKSTMSTFPGEKQEETGKNSKQSQVGRGLENNLEIEVEKTQKQVEEVKETPKEEDRFTIEKCVAVLEAMPELTDVEKAKVLKLFKCGLNREIFMTTKSASLRLTWLKSEIYA